MRKTPRTYQRPEKNQSPAKIPNHKKMTRKFPPPLCKKRLSCLTQKFLQRFPPKSCKNFTQGLLKRAAKSRVWKPQPRKWKTILQRNKSKTQASTITNHQCAFLETHCKQEHTTIFAQQWRVKAKWPLQFIRLLKKKSVCQALLRPICQKKPHQKKKFWWNRKSAVCQTSVL